MTVSRRAALSVSVAALLTARLLGSAAAEEKLVATYGEERTVLAFKLPDAAAQKLLPASLPWYSRQVTLPDEVTQ